MDPVEKKSQALTAPQVAARLQLSRALVYALIQRGELPAVHIGRSVRVLPDDLDRWLQARRDDGPSARGAMSW